MTFPVETVPDGAVWAPHHATYLLGAALLALMVVWDDHRSIEPLMAAVGVLAGLFGFLFVWPFYPLAGFALALGSPVLSLVAVWLGPFGADWGARYPRHAQVVVTLSILGALDDVVSHGFGVWTPLDSGWAVLGPNASAAVAAVVVIAGVSVMLGKWSRTGGEP